MSVPLTRYGAVTGLAGGDARIQVGGKGRKNVLAVTASYQQATVIAPAADFQGRLVVIDGQIDPLATSNFAPNPPDFPITTDFSRFGKVLFDVRFSTVGPHPLFLPIAQQEGSPQSDEDSTVNIVLCIGRDSALNQYIPVLSVSGQTVFGGYFAGQQSFTGGVS